MIYLVTGGTGFIGAHVVRDLVMQGHKVVCYDIAPNDQLLKEVIGGKPDDQVIIYRGDVTDATQLFHALKQHKVDKIVHLASLLTISSEANFPLALKVNCQGTNNIFEGAALFGVTKVVWASSVAVFGPNSIGPGGLVLNDAPHDPKSVYGACKSYNENMAIHYILKRGLDIIGLRYTLVYGYGKAETVGRGSGVTVMTNLIERPALDQGPCEVLNGDDEYDWLYVEDVVQSVVKASQVGKTKTRAFNIVGDKRLTREVFAEVKRLLPDADMTLQPGTSGRLWNYDGSAAQEEFGYIPEYTMEEGVRNNINLLRDRAGLPPVH